MYYNKSSVVHLRLLGSDKYRREKYIMLPAKNYQFWFCTGSQDLYGDECLAHVAEHSQKIVEALNASGNLPYEVVWKPTLITNALIRKTFNEANNDEEMPQELKPNPRYTTIERNGITYNSFIRVVEGDDMMNEGLNISDVKYIITIKKK